MVRSLLIVLVMTGGLPTLLPHAARAQDYTLFESDPVRPLAITPDGRRLLATNTPDGRLEVLDLKSDGMTWAASVPVGLEPVAVAVRGDEAWVVNHVSDSVSVVDLAASPPRVVRTIPVGDEPRDVVFAGPGERWAFVTAAHRGQSSPYARGEFEQAGQGRADVWVFDADAPGPSGTGTPSTLLTFFADKPRALAVSPDGNTVYAAAFHSGNGTTTVTEGAVCDGGASAAPCLLEDGLGTSPGGLPAPNVNHEGFAGAETGLIVKQDPVSGVWRDETGRDWSGAVRFSLPDLDVFQIDAAPESGPPVALGGVLDGYRGVGTILFNMAVNPVSGRVYVSNTEANNLVRFEGEGTLASLAKSPGVPASVIGHLHEARITVLDGAEVKPRHLNKHIDYEVRPVPPGLKEHSLATPVGMEISSDGSTLYVAAFGSSRIGVLDTEALEADSFDPAVASARYIDVAGGGPAGLALDEARGRLYVLTRFDNAVSAVDLSSGVEIRRIALPNPEPAEVVAGRPLLYDANLTSSNGEASCSSCHVFGDMDDLAWDLGDPDGDVIANLNPFERNQVGDAFHPLKGPMTTQSLRGMSNHGPMHWRGDRSGANASPPADALDERAAFAAFNPAFVGLLGREEGELSDDQMSAFTDFALSLRYPPSPTRRLDNELRPDEQRGSDVFFAPNGPDGRACSDCHTTDRASGFFGGRGTSSFEGEPQQFKVPHLRNLYQKVGMFGMPDVPFMQGGDNGAKGPQIRGFGFLHDGSTDTLFRFLRATVFNGFDRRFQGDLSRADVEAFMIVADTGLAPVVGQQATLDGDNLGAVGGTLSLLVERAGQPYATLEHPAGNECDYVVKGVVAGEPRSWAFAPGTGYVPDRESEPARSAQEMIAIAGVAGQALTATCMPPGSLFRAGLDRDRDGVRDADDNCPATWNPTQSDFDGDGAGDACDTCLIAFDPEQLDTNGDRIGNWCDADLDNDDDVDLADADAFIAALSTPTPDADFDGNGAIDTVDWQIFLFWFQQGLVGPSTAR